MGNLLQNAWDIFGYGKVGIGKTASAIQKQGWGVSLPPYINTGLALGTQIAGGAVLAFSVAGIGTGASAGAAGASGSAGAVAASGLGSTGAILAATLPGAIAKTAEVGLGFGIMDYLNKNPWVLPALLGVGVLYFMTKGGKK